MLHDAWHQKARAQTLLKVPSIYRRSHRSLADLLSIAGCGVRTSAGCRVRTGAGCRVRTGAGRRVRTGAGCRVRRLVAR